MMHDNSSLGLSNLRVGVASNAGRVTSLLRLCRAMDQLAIPPPATVGSNWHLTGLTVHFTSSRARNSHNGASITLKCDPSGMALYFAQTQSGASPILLLLAAGALVIGNVRRLQYFLFECAIIFSLTSRGCMHVLCVANAVRTRPETLSQPRCPPPAHIIYPSRTPMRRASGK
ncbi:hypothetical protein BC826DRAFT_166338 [Russula brevipes]|nr:hypothetical protein BC826DRAFT_166338 [Russula brevipes]